MKDRRISKTKFSLLFPVVLIATIIFSTPPAHAIPVEDIPASIWRTVKDLVGKTGSQIFNNALRTTVNQLAYDYATYLGSGAPGQKPFFEQKSLGDRMVDAGDAAFGTFVENVASTGKFDEKGNPIPNNQQGQVDANGKKIYDLNLCSPDIFTLNKITLGLTSFKTPGYQTGACSFRNMKRTWQSEYDQITSIVNDKEYLSKVGQYFKPGENDLSITLELFGQTEDSITTAKLKTQQESTENKGWLRVETLVGKKYTNPPDSEERRLDLQNQLTAKTIGTYTGNVLVDAANIFLNQLALTAFNKLMNNIGSSSANSNRGVADQYAQGSNGGTLDIENKLSTIVEARFSERADYNILSDLITCQNPDKPGPTNCVITDAFGTAISNRMTVIEAMNAGYLKGDYSFGFKGLNNAEPDYNQGYPYRSLLILRKYRIIPVGWELAAQYIQKNNKDANPPVNTQDVKLIDLIRCFDPCDEYRGYNDGTTTGNDCIARTPAIAESWCTGLVDPNWVLKASQMYCKAQGYGPEIQDSQYIPQGKFCTETPNGTTKTAKACVDKCSNLTGNFDSSTCCQTGEGECETKSTLSVTRNENYCADEQSCIKENSDGSCAYYGYCTEEKRRWIFSDNNNNQCDAVNNTCQTFSGNGKTVSYLENTLDFGNCGPNQVGCKKYAVSGPYTSSTNTIAWDTAKGSIHLNNNATNCDPDKEGCHQFIRIKDDADTNVIADGSFEGSQCITGSILEGGNTQAPQDKLNSFIKGAFAQVSSGTCQLTNIPTPGATLTSPNNRWYVRANSGTVKAGIVNDKSDHGSQSLYVEGNGGLYSRDSQTPTILPAGLTFENDRFYTLSVMVYVAEGKVKAGFGTSNNGQSAESTATNAWQNLIITYYRPTNGANDFYVEGTDSTAKFYIDSVKLSVGAASTSYSDYFAKNVIYQKLLPAYLESTCYEAAGGAGTPKDGASVPSYNYTYKTNAPSICFNFARKCNAEEVGCEEYTSLHSGISVTGKVKPKDFCPGTCLGYDVFVEQPTYFSLSTSQYFIPRTAQACSAQATGCTAFTNLDKLAQGGEAVEYYSYLRTCTKPDAASCGEFYTWEGSDESGYQLQVYSLKKNGDEPMSTLSPAEELGLCNEAIFKKDPNEVGYNYDCREFYGRDGKVSYHLYSHTISCSEDCHPYRREVASSQECTSGGGTWDATQSRCIHYSIPGQGTSCSAAEVGCREYTGNIANNTEVVLNDTFESTSEPTNGWTGGAQSNTALNLGGHSLVGSNFAKTIGDIVTRGESYTVTFLARVQSGSSATITGIDFINNSSQSASFATSGAAVGTEWKLYTFNLGKLEHEVNPISGSGDASTIGEKFRINFSQGVYIDNIKLTQVPDRYYLIKDSWQTPDECDQTVTGAYSPRYMLGCSEYTTKNNQTVNLHSFSQLCQDSAAGCEQMIDTHNSGDYKKRLYNDTNNNGVCDTGETSCVEVAADSIMNVVYDSTKQCGETDKGCSRLGAVTTYENSTTYTDIYKKRDPDKYNTSLCSAEAVGCEAWTTSTGTSYFKDPGDQVCEYRKEDNEYGWFKVQVKRCGGLASGNLCSSDSQCTAPQTCQKVTTSIPCDTSISKTVGTGGRGNEVQQPSGAWAGLCAAAQSGCTEYIDPVSKFNNNLVFNPSFDDLDKNTIDGDGWIGPDQVIDNTKIEPNTLYILKGAGASIKGWGNNQLYQLDPSTNDFRLVDNSNPFKAVPANTNGAPNSTEFFVVDTSGFSSFTVSGGARGKTIELRKAIIGYQLKQNVDRSPTSVDFKTGKVLFNERSVSGSSKQRLVYNADQTVIDSSRGNPPSTSGQLNSNVILKVSADRTCDKWLACRSYGVDSDNPSKQTCFDIGLCNSLSANGECQNFVENVPTTNSVFNYGNRDQYANLTGYSKVGYEGNLLKTDMYNLSVMKQVGAAGVVPDGSFELGTEKWLTQGSIIQKPSETQDVAYPDSTLPDGSAVLRLDQGKDAVTKYTITLSRDTRYIISAYIYNRTGNATVQLLDSVGGIVGGHAVIDTAGDGTKNQWLRKVGEVTTGRDTEYKIRLFADRDGTYFDDIRIEAALNQRCNNSNDPTCDDADKWYTPSSCRLYPKADSLACMYQEADSNIKQKGWRGYCLEWDPKNQTSCLLWYPVDKIVSEGAEEGAGVIIPDNLTYCLETEGYCPSATVNQVNSEYYLASNPYGDTFGARATNADGGAWMFKKINNAGPDKPVYKCTKVVLADSSKYWRTRWMDGSGYILDKKATNKIEFVPAVGGEVSVGFDNTSQFGGGESFSTSTMRAYTGAASLNNSNGVPFVNSNDNASCTAYLRVKDDFGNNCNPHYTTLGDWKSCGCTYSGECAPGESCTGGEFGCNMSGWRVCTTQKAGNTWQGVTTDQEKDDGDPDYTISRFSCQSPIKFSYDGTKAANPSQDLLSSIFVKSSGSWKLSGTSYIPDTTIGLADVTSSSRVCSYAKKCVNNGNTCTQDSDCPGSICFTDRPRITSSGSFNYATDYCSIYPRIFNIKVGKYNIGSGQVEVVGGGYVDLRFNSKIDPDQLPLALYKIDWDGDLTRGIIPSTDLQHGNLYDRPNSNSPHVFRTYFSYQEIYSNNQTEGGSLCGLNKDNKCPELVQGQPRSCCVLKPYIKIQDNWDTYREITSNNFPVEIVVTDR